MCGEVSERRRRSQGQTTRCVTDTVKRSVRLERAQLTGANALRALSLFIVTGEGLKLGSCKAKQNLQSRMVIAKWDTEHLRIIPTTLMANPLESQSFVPG